MRTSISQIFCTAVMMVMTLSSPYAGQIASAVDPLPSWQAGPTKTQVLTFVHRVSNPDSEQYVPTVDRVAVFDNDGTLWCERPVYPQLVFALEKLRQQAVEDPTLLKQPIMTPAF